VQRSFTVHGDAEEVEGRRRELVERFGVDRSALYCEGARWSLAQLLTGSSPRTTTGVGDPVLQKSVARFLSGDPVGEVGLAGLSPVQVEAAFSRWRSAGASPAMMWARWAVLGRRCLGRRPGEV